MSTGGCPQVVAKKVEVLKEYYNVVVVEWECVAWLFVVQRNRVINMIGDKFISLSENKEYELFNTIEDYNPDFDKIFMTGDISNGYSGYSSTVFQVQFVDPRIIKTLQMIKNSNHKTNSKNSLGIEYVGEIEYKTAARSHVSGKSHIWIRLNRSFGKVRYYVEIINNNNDFYGEHVKVALETLCIKKCNLIIEALRKLGINLKNNSLKNNVHNECMNFNWTFPIKLLEQNN